ncbi:hypothetical protein FIV42_20255 [Persicimonas caeni]|uniref:Uncharacterized protein n=1 Tax=Persicimonas caeni TaxID=2292766 RepID=A0A4Y6PXK6_PERCE|nr:hypothetical protein [Persicimonas caeni]QDG52993.1 hypothetical protein FIV42_20255 [Persicimonas caeni]QED34215.1 hypothetical protein FRD00_20250 [Persicimonas caeni]
MLHVRYEGRSYDFHERQLDIDQKTSDHEIRQRLANYFEVDRKRFKFYVIDRPNTGNIIVRPEAVYG